MRDYVLRLEEPLSIEDLKPLIGEEFEIADYRWSWGKRVIQHDKLLVTNIKVTMDVGSSKTTGLSAVHIYSDYWLKDKKSFNAWTSLEGFQNYLRQAELEKNQPETD